MSTLIVRAYAGFVGDECQVQTVFAHERGVMVNMLHTRGGVTILAATSDERIREEWERRRDPDWEVRPVVIMTPEVLARVAEGDLCDRVRLAVEGD